MPIRIFKYLSVVSLATCLLNTLGCGDSSDFPLNESHHAGESCMDCHSEDGEASSLVFTVAGTIFKSEGVQPDATIRVYISGTDDVRATLTTDDSGNFYQTEGIGPLGEGVYFSAEVETPLNVKRMTFFMTEGDCNDCHHPGFRVIVD